MQTATLEIEYDSLADKTALLNKWLEKYSNKLICFITQSTVENNTLFYTLFYEEPHPHLISKGHYESK